MPTKDYCERDLVKERLDIDAEDDTYDAKIDAAIGQASAIVENEMAPIGGVPHPIPGIIEHACADIAAAVFLEPKNFLVEQPLYQRGLDRIAQYKHRHREIPFVVGEDTSGIGY